MMKVQLYLLLALVVCDIIFSVIADGALEGRENRQERLDSIHQSPDRSKLESDGDIYADEEDYYSELISEEVFNEIREELMQEDSEFEPDQQQTETTPNEQQERQQESPNTKQNPQQRTSSGKNNIKAGSKLRNALPKKGEGHATASRKSMRAQESKGGSYYGGGAFFHSKKSPPNGSTQESEEKVTGAGEFLSL
ncbi:hypothetical protein EON65_11430 [archaeon]|nr:MAG: hypothetical protein EON65_11430 [archaeon]